MISLNFQKIIRGFQTDFTWIFSEEIYNLTSKQCQNIIFFTLEADPSSSQVYIHFMNNTTTIDCTGSTHALSILGYPSTANILGPVSHVN